MKKRIDTFWRYRNLLFELVKKGIVSEEDIEKGRTKKATEVIKELRTKYGF